MAGPVSGAADAGRGPSVRHHLPSSVRSKKSIDSAIDETPGIGPRRKKALLRQFGSVQGLREAPIDQIAAVPGMTLRLAEKVKGSL